MDLEHTESEGRWHPLPYNDWRVVLVKTLERAETQLARIAAAIEGTHATTITAPATASFTLTGPPRETTPEKPEPAPPALVPFPLKSISRTASGGCIVRITETMSEVGWSLGEDGEPFFLGGSDRTFAHQIPCPYTTGFLRGFVVGEADPDGLEPLYPTTPLDIAAELAKAEQGAS